MCQLLCEKLTEQELRQLPGQQLQNHSVNASWLTLLLSLPLPPSMPTYQSYTIYYIIQVIIVAPVIISLSVQHVHI